MILKKAVSNPQATTNLIIVMGVSGSGKSTLAKALADHYGYDFLDGDDFHSAEARALMAEGVPLTDEHRAPWVAAIKQHLQTSHRDTTLAFSGLKKKHRDVLRSAGLRTIVLYLTADKGTIEVRIANRKGHFMAPALLDSQFASMEEPAGEADVYNINVSASLDQVMAEAIRLVDEVLLEKVGLPG